MKKVLVPIFTLLLVAVTTISCNKNSPKDVATAWLNSFYHLDYDAAKKTSTEDTKALLATLQQFTTMISDSDKKDRKKVTITVKDVKENGDKATVTYTTSDNPGKDEPPLNLIKQDGKWLVQFTKDDKMNGAADSTSTEPPMGADSTAPTSGNAADSGIH